MLQQLLNTYQIILGSKSPRRQQFLKDLNIPFEIRTSDCDEVYPHHLTSEKITEFLAEQKSNTIKISNNELLITADTIVWANNKALEKPSNKEEACKMLETLSGTCHEVITSVCIATHKKSIVFTDKTKVYFEELDSEEINFYINHYKPFDKAGSYGIQEWIGWIGVSRIEGSYANVVGIPTSKLYKELKNFL
ncbi:Maf family nucleotide pyrophosphatase [Wenyingzhuangia sp. 2_MG-2023]|uniref:Maf family nucleotide pyrophosphatase n=1 Tax=Wenyingzhuangia sp. 2_MG-2023 TaxID=3062639 RepID=UPI0026E27DBA|nr:Maf family nucleotide pyrophosphatase [Wenyingzhuangia sp. 2_MG-2023]MDO6737308.1 Maf family nucleotide pyrophosphatase [Wenyingzhuangia sp. 2_MG-2023]MDO6801612.1 Maf family nucleotide pyrophosphatase [Wenyingzhuangia sp. 1_MG-2023]